VRDTAAPASDPGTSDRGASAVEYALLAAAVAGVATLGLTALIHLLGARIDCVSSGLSSGGSRSCAPEVPGGPPDGGGPGPLATDAPPDPTGTAPRTGTTSAPASPSPGTPSPSTPSPGSPSPRGPSPSPSTPSPGSPSPSSPSPSAGSPSPGVTASPTGS